MAHDTLPHPFTISFQQLLTAVIERETALVDRVMGEAATSVVSSRMAEFRSAVYGLATQAIFVLRALDRGDQVNARQILRPAVERFEKAKQEVGCE